MPATYLVTGASSGIGLDLCKQLLARGDIVVATCRQRASSMSKQDLITELEQKSEGKVIVLEGLDVACDDVGEKLCAALETKGISKLDVVIHNAGSIGGGGPSREPGSEVPHAQSFAGITMDKMRSAFEVNTLGPLRVQQAVTPLMKGGKVAIISTGFGSIADNTSGGTYAYRASKAAVNMVGKSMSCDLKKEHGIAVVMIAPGHVVTEFGPGAEKMKEWGGAPVEQAGAGVIKCLDELTLETAGKFWMIKTKTGEVEEFPW